MIIKNSYLNMYSIMYEYFHIKLFDYFQTCVNMGKHNMYYNVHV